MECLPGPENTVQCDANPQMSADLTSDIPTHVRCFTNVSNESHVQGRWALTCSISLYVPLCPCFVSVSTVFWTLYVLWVPSERDRSVILRTSIFLFLLQYKGLLRTFGGAYEGSQEGLAHWLIPHPSP